MPLLARAALVAALVVMGSSRAWTAPIPVKIATWNLEWLNAENNRGNVKRNNADYASLRKYADRLDADVVAFQEVDGVDAAKRVFDPAVYAFHAEGRSDDQLPALRGRRTSPPRASR